MAGQSSKPRIDLPRLTAADLVDRGLHIIKNPALRHTAQHAEGLRQGVEQHLMGLEQIGPHDESAAMRQLGMGHLQLDLLAAQNRIILAPVELEGLTWLENQRHEGPAPAGLLLILAIALPTTGKGRHSGIRAVIPECDEIGIKLLGRPFLFARLARFHLEPTGQLLSKWVQFARPIGNSENRLHRVGAKIFADRVAR
jgi:hypothetical protein